MITQSKPLWWKNPENLNKINKRRKGQLWVADIIQQEMYIIEHYNERNEMINNTIKQKKGTVGYDI